MLKTSTAHIDALGESIAVRELTARAQIEIIEAADRPFEGLFIACRYGVPAWSDKTVDQLKDELTLAQANEVAAAVFGLSGFEPGN